MQLDRVQTVEEATGDFRIGGDLQLIGGGHTWVFSSVSTKPCLLP
jgi:hypothetical protein